MSQIHLMDQIFTLPSTMACSRWIETNDAETELSEIQVTNTHCIVPQHIYEDSLVEDDYLSEHVIDNDIVGGRVVVSYPRHLLSHIQTTRSNSYRACIWYPEVVDKIPTAHSILLAVNSIEHLQLHLRDNITPYPFVRLCTMSPKDVRAVPIYNITNVGDAVKDITQSQRTNNIFSEPYCDECHGKHLFMREHRNYEWEARCFWSRDKLRAISLSTDRDFTNQEKQEIINFFDVYGEYIPYHSAVVDIGKVENYIELIEFNTFGPDMKATAGNFSWYEDVMILIHAPVPQFR